MEHRRQRAGTPITPQELEELRDEQLARLVPRACREFFPGKDLLADGCFYLHDGHARSLFKGAALMTLGIGANRLCGNRQPGSCCTWRRRTRPSMPRAPATTGWRCGAHQRAGPPQALIPQHAVRRVVQ